MFFYHSLGSLKIADLDKKINNPKNFVIAVLKLLELIDTWGSSESIDGVSFPYLCIDTSRLKRAFIVKNNQIVSFAFPFAIHSEQGSLRVCINYRDKQLDSSIISKAMSLANSLDLERSTYASLAQGINLSDPAQLSAVQIFEVALSLEPSYLRYDYDSNSDNGVKHPLFHFDVNYNKQCSYKLGLYGVLNERELMNIMSNDTSCWYVRPFSYLLGMKYWIKKCRHH